MRKPRTLIIQGVAGSGKTSIAPTPHRLLAICFSGGQYLFKRHIDWFLRIRCLPIISLTSCPNWGKKPYPNPAWNRYFPVLNHKYKYLSFFEQVNELLTKPTPDFIERIEYKSSFDFIASLDRFILHIENHYFWGGRCETNQTYHRPG